MVAKQDFERFLNKRARNVSCAICGHHDWMMDVSGSTDNILMLCSHCGHVVSFDRDYVESLIERDKNTGNYSSDDDCSDANDHLKRRHPNLTVEPTVEAIESTIDFPAKSVEPTREICRAVVNSSVEEGTQVRDRLVNSRLGFVDRLCKAIFNLIVVVKAKLHPL